MQRRLQHVRRKHFPNQQLAARQAQVQQLGGPLGVESLHRVLKNQHIHIRHHRSDPVANASANLNTKLRVVRTQTARAQCTLAAG